MASASQGLLATATGGGVTGRLDAGRGSTDDANGDISPSTYRGGIYSILKRVHWRGEATYPLPHTGWRGIYSNARVYN
jgi:hypothetical protein